MPANTSPIFPLTPHVSFGKVLTANTATDGTGTQVGIFTATSNGSRVDYLKCRALGTNIATVLRVFVNNGATNATATNNSLIYETTLAASTGNAAAECGTDILIPVNLPLPSTYVINIAVGTTVASGWQVTAVGGDY